MLTQIQIPEPQAALLAACPRPRAVAPSALMPLMPSSSPAWVGVVRLGAVAEERRRGFAAAASGTRGFGYAAAARVVAGTVGNGNGNGTASKQQDKQHLTSRREPVTWRPPH
jgi:hypothetical protein